MKKLLTAALIAGCLGSLATDANARDRLAFNGPLVTGNDTIVNNDVGGSDDFGDVGPTADVDPDENPYTPEDWEFKLFDDPDVPGKQYLMIDGTVFDDIVQLSLTENGGLRIVGDSTVNGTVVASIDEVFNPNFISRVNIYVLDGSNIIDNATDVFLKAFGGNGVDTINGGYGSAVIFAEDGDDHVTMAFGKSAYIDGGPGDDTLIGSDFDDSIIGDSGHDTIDGRGGDDYLEGDDFGSNLWGACDGVRYDDVIFGGRGDDIINGGLWIDEIHGGPGDDVLDGFVVITPNHPLFFQDDRVTDDEDEDILFGDQGADTFKVHDWRLFDWGYADYPQDYDWCAGDSLDIEVHTDWTPW